MYVLDSEDYYAKLDFIKSDISKFVEIHIKEQEIHPVIYIKEQEIHPVIKKENSVSYCITVCMNENGKKVTTSLIPTRRVSDKLYS